MLKVYCIVVSYSSFTGCLKAHRTLHPYISIRQKRPSLRQREESSSRGIMAPRKGRVHVGMFTRPARELGDVEEPQFGLDHVRTDEAISYRNGGHTLDNAEACAVLAAGVGVRAHSGVALDIDGSTVWIVRMA